MTTRQLAPSRGKWIAPFRWQPVLGIPGVPRRGLFDRSLPVAGDKRPDCTSHLDGIESMLRNPGGRLRRAERHRTKRCSSIIGRTFPSTYHDPLALMIAGNHLNVAGMECLFEEQGKTVNFPLIDRDDQHRTL